MAEATATQTNPAATAKALLDSGENLLISERLMVRQVRDYAAKYGISASDAQSYISYLNGASGRPAWLDQPQPGADGKSHALSRELFAINLLQTDRDGHLNAFRAAAAANGANADSGIAGLRAALLAADPKADETAIAMFNAMGERNGKPFSNYLTDLAYPQQGIAYLNGIDKPEFFARKANELGAAISNKAGQLWNSGSAAASQAASSIAGTAQSAGEQGGALSGIGDFFGGLWEKGKNNFPGLAGGFGVGALFYMVSNALSASVLGNGWISRIIGLAIGAFGAMLGFRTFGRDSSDSEPRSRVEAGRGLSYEGPAVGQENNRHLREDARRSRAQARMEFHNPNDTDGVPGLSNEELLAQIQRDSAHIRQMNQGSGEQLCPTDVFAVQGSPRCPAPRQR